MSMFDHFPDNYGPVQCCCNSPECRRDGCKAVAERKRMLSGERVQAQSHGCICPPTSEQTCQSWQCPRKSPAAQYPGQQSSIG